MQWIEHGERTVYDSEWLSVRLVDVEVPGGRRFEHHAIRGRRPAVGVVVHDRDRGVLLLWRHRFIPGVWGWEVPAGGVEEGEDLAVAAAREVLEETGWQPGPLRHLHGYRPMIGLSDGRFELYAADGAAYVGQPSDPSESERIEWVPVERVRELLREHAVVDGLTLTALLWWLAER